MIDRPRKTARRPIKLLGQASSWCPFRLSAILGCMATSYCPSCCRNTFPLCPCVPPHLLSQPWLLSCINHSNILCIGHPSHVRFCCLSHNCDITISYQNNECINSSFVPLHHCLVTAIHEHLIRPRDTIDMVLTVCCEYIWLSLRRTPLLPHSNYSPDTW